MGDGTPAGRGEIWLDEQALVDFFEQRPQYAFAFEGPEFRFVATNAALRQLAGGRPLLGIPVFEAFEELADQGIAELYQRVYETGEAELGREWAVHLRHPDGTEQVVWSNHSVMPGETSRAASSASGASPRTSPPRSRPAGPWRPSCGR